MAVFSLLQNLLCEWCQNRKQITYKHIHFVNSSVVSILSYNIHMVLIWLWQCFVYICARSFATQKLTGRKRLNGTMTLCVVFLLAQLFIVRKKKYFLLLLVENRSLIYAAFFLQKKLNLCMFGWVKKNFSSLCEIEKRSNKKIGMH